MNVKFIFGLLVLNLLILALIAFYFKWEERHPGNWGTFLFVFNIILYFMIKNTFFK